MTVFDDIKTGLEQAIAYEKGKGTAKVTKLSVEPLTKYEAKKIKEIRKETGLTQVLFAQLMGVSVKTVEAWESGRNHPEGSSCRLLKMIERDAQFPEKSGIISGGR